jgi:uridine phosphorylase
MAQLMPHTSLEAGAVSPAVLVCGDPARATYIASFLDEAVLLAESREYCSYQGKYHGRTLTICSHGIGAPGAAIAFEELIAAGAKTIIRVGTCGGIQPDIQAGEVVIATAAVDNTGYGREIAPPGYPAVADPTVTLALWAAAEGVRPSHLGLVLSRDAFYGGVATPFVPDYRMMVQANVLAVEMECAALFLVGSLRKARTGAILAVNNNVFQTQESMDSFQPQTEAAQQAIDAAIQIALAAFGEMRNEK